jgi:GTPase SAR1 family protein
MSLQPHHQTDGQGHLRRSPTIVPLLQTQAPQSSSQNAAQLPVDGLMAPSSLLLSTLSDLQSHGVDTNLPVPKIVMVGDQSAGKSSLIEALTTIQVPRGVGTTTRCPLEINIINEPGPFRAEISLVNKFMYDASNDDSLWSPIRDAVKPIIFCEVQNKTELGRAIKLAQYAILNPFDDPAKFRPGGSNDDDQRLSQAVQFSPNIVVVKIKGAEFQASLSFIDLPGLIHHAEGSRPEDSTLPDLIQELASRYIRDENTLIVMVVSMVREGLDRAVISS